MRAPVNEAADLVRERIDADAVSIYEHWRENGEDCFHLTGTAGIGAERGSSATALRRRARERGEPWVGLTSFVAFHDMPLMVEDSATGASVTVIDERISVRIDNETCEFPDPGPFLAAPVRDPSTKKVVGVIRAVRKKGRTIFTVEEEVILVWIARFLAPSFVQERVLRGNLIDGLMSIALLDDEKKALDRIVEEAKTLTHGARSAVAVLLQDPQHSGSDGPTYSVCAPTTLVREMDPTAVHYPYGCPGLTPLVLFKSWPHVLSRNLTADTQPGAPLHLAGHQPKRAELGPSTAVSFVAVPIPGDEGSLRPLGAIRVCSPDPGAFSYRDVETLHALAAQTRNFLLEKDRRDTLFQEVIDSARWPIVSMKNQDDNEVIDFVNKAMLELLGAEVADVKGKSVTNVLYGGRHAVAEADRMALVRADERGKHLRDQYTTIFRPSQTMSSSGEPIPHSVAGSICIPVRMDKSFLRSALTRRTVGTIAFVKDLRRRDAESTITQLSVPADTSGEPPEVALTVDAPTAREMRRALDLPRNTPRVLVYGETGTGKELLARAIGHHLREEKPRAVNCAGLSDEVLESDLFGAVKGAFTSVNKDRAGVFDPKLKSGIILDEIQELTLRVQAKLLRVLQSGMVRLVGGTSEAKVDSPVIIVTNADLAARVKAGTFREDLRFRLGRVYFELRPLRTRTADIMQLAFHFLKEEQGVWLGQRRDQSYGGPEGFDSDAIRCLFGYTWPGNIRELQSAVSRAFAQTVLENGDLISYRALPEDIRNGDGQALTGSTGHAPAVPDRLAALEQVVNDLTVDLRRLREKAPVAGRPSWKEFLKQKQDDPKLRLLIQGHKWTLILEEYLKPNGHDVRIQRIQEFFEPPQVS